MYLFKGDIVGNRNKSAELKKYIAKCAGVKIICFVDLPGSEHSGCHWEEVVLNARRMPGGLT